LTPELVLSLPKPTGRKGRGNTRKKRTAAVLTDTPVKAALRDKQNSLKLATKRKAHQKGNKRRLII
jgi:hypothetical protein